MYAANAVPVQVPVPVRWVRMTMPRFAQNMKEAPRQPSPAACNWITTGSRYGSLCCPAYK